MEDYQPTEEELRLASSDLEDSEEIWRQEIDDFALESHKRHRYVEIWFNENSLVGALLLVSPQ